MRILWIHQYFATPRGWGAVRTYEFARRFVRAGHAVDVVCCAGYDDSLRPTGRAPRTVDGVRVFVSRTAYRPQMGFVRRVVSFLRFMAGAVWFVLRHGRVYDLVIASSGPLTLAVPALVGRWLWRVPFVFEVIDVWPDSAIAAGVLKNPVLKWLSFRLEALAYRYAKVIVTCSTGMTGRVRGKLLRPQSGFDCRIKSGKTTRGLSGRNGEGKKGREGASEPQVVTISNCCDLEMFVLDEAVRRETRRKYGVGDEQMVVLYSGAMGRSNAMEDVAEAMDATADDGRIVWWMAGDGIARGDLSRKGAKTQRGGGEQGERALVHECISSLVGEEGENAERRTLNAQCSSEGEDAKRPREEVRVRWFGRMAKEEVVELYLAADVNVVTFRCEPLFFENSPNKFFDGIAAGLPAVFNRTTWLEPWLKEYDCGVVCKGERPGAEMAEVLRKLASDAECRQRMGVGARRLAEEVFSRDRLAELYLEVSRKGAKTQRGGIESSRRGTGETGKGAQEEELA